MSKNRTTSAVKATIKDFESVRARINLDARAPMFQSIQPLLNYGHETPEMQQLRSNRIGSRFYKKICPVQPMTSAEIKDAFKKA